MMKFDLGTHHLIHFSANQRRFIAQVGEVKPKYETAIKIPVFLIENREGSLLNFRFIVPRLF